MLSLHLGFILLHMLKHLLIENYALIDHLDISFDEGFTVITGETGAGKSILLGALSLILGKRADSTVLSNPTKKCIIEGSFDLKDLDLQTMFGQFDLDHDDISIFRREINPQGKSRAFINDTPVKLDVMKTLAGKLIDIHSQHESLWLGHPDFQFDVVDAYADLTKEKSGYRKLFAQYQQKQSELSKRREEAKNARADLDYCQYQFNELEAARLSESEYETLEEEAKIARNAEDIKLKLEKAAFLLEDSDPGALGMLSEIEGLLGAVSEFGNTYEELAKRMESVVIETRDLATEIQSLKEGIQLDAHHSAQLENRLDEINQLLHKHSVTSVKSLLEIKENYNLKIKNSTSLDDQIEELALANKEMEATLRETAHSMSKKRAGAIPLLQKEVVDLLRLLGMPHAGFRVAQSQTEQFNSQGLDYMRFLFNANQEDGLQDISKVASGGERSRFLLAIKRMITQKSLLPTIIFDEIDTGISGEMGSRVADILSHMANKMQVVAITHLPQIAARGENHLLVYKEVKVNQSFSRVKPISQEERVKEIAKMLGGEKPSKVMEETAKELIFNKKKQPSK